LILFSACLCETAMLEECVSGHGHERVTMEGLRIVPRSDQPEFLFQLLMSLFANPSGFDRVG
jgi:hypothetical protein